MQAKSFIEQLQANGIDAYYGVPDSLLKNICAYITDYADASHHIITANEGNAIGLACGHYLATARPALVYMQNSGQGNCVNPLLSLMDGDVYSIPVLLLIGWRGEPGVKDEPQHLKQGKVTLTLLESMAIEYTILSPDECEAQQQIATACTYMQQQKKPYALVVRKGTFEAYSLQNKRAVAAEMRREEAICLVAEQLNESDIIVATTGQISRELYEHRSRCQASHQSDFLTVGGMGHASSIAMGIALQKPERQIICMDGDGALIMHMGAMGIIGNSGLQNLKHIVFNNSAHDSVGGQPTIAERLNIGRIASSCGYTAVYKANTKEELLQIMPEFSAHKGIALLEIAVQCGARSDLGRPKERPTENKKAFMNFVEEGCARIRPGAANEISHLIEARGWQRVLLFSTERCFQENQELIKAQLQGVTFSRYSAITPNPAAEDVQEAVKSINFKADTILAIGGGSVIDFAKLYRASIDNNINILSYFKDKTPLIRKTPLLAVPTTAGTGSEATRFAVVYINGEKYSLDAPAVMPDYAIVDSNLMCSAPTRLKASCGMDAFAQAIEGFWAQGATEESDRYAKLAISLCRDNLVNFVNSKNSHAAAAMAKASYLAGKCISIARTTAAHALSYKITQLYGIPHGHAVALSLPGLAELHHTRSDKASLLSNKMTELVKLLKIEGSSFCQYFKELYSLIGLEYRISALGIKSITEIASTVNLERLSNNPLMLNQKDLESVFQLS